MDDRGEFEPDHDRRDEPDHDRRDESERYRTDPPGTLPSDAPAGDRAWVQRFGPQYTFFDLVRRRRERGLSVQVLVGLLLTQLTVVGLLVYWVM